MLGLFFKGVKLSETRSWWFGLGESASGSIDKPIKYTTHDWDFGALGSGVYSTFDEFMEAVKKQFTDIEHELKELSPNLYKKAHAFLIEENPDKSYSWCHKTKINIGWSSLEGLKEHCNKGKKPGSFKLPKVIFYDGKDLTTFEDIINLFKQEIEIRENFKNLEKLFELQMKKLGTGRKSIFKLDLSTAKLSKQFYTDVESVSNVLDKIFLDFKTREDYPNIKVLTKELEDRSVEIHITQVRSFSTKPVHEVVNEVKDGDFAQIKEGLKNLCDWSVESKFREEGFRINFLHSNNVKEIEKSAITPEGFTHIFRFYK